MHLQAISMSSARWDLQVESHTKWLDDVVAHCENKVSSGFCMDNIGCCRPGQPHLWHCLHLASYAWAGISATTPAQRPCTQCPTVWHAWHLARLCWPQPA